jgi:hypothetical protein
MLTTTPTKTMGRTPTTTRTMKDEEDEDEEDEESTTTTMRWTPKWRRPPHGISCPPTSRTSSGRCRRRLALRRGKPSQKRLKEVESGLGRAFQEARAERKELARLKAERKHNEDHPADFIADLIDANPKLLDELNEELENRETRKPIAPPRR